MRTFTRQYHIKPNTVEFNECKRLCGYSANLYNVVMSEIYDYYKKNNTFKLPDGKYIFNKYNLYAKYKNHEAYICDDSYKGQRANSKIMKTPFILIDRNFKGFYAALKSYYQNKSKFKGKPKFPRNTITQQVVMIEKSAYSLKDNKIKISRSDIEIDISDLITMGHDRSTIGEVQITPCTYGYKISVTYKVKVDVAKEKTKSEITRIAGLDMGVNNLAAVAFNISDVKPFLINGRKLKYKNQHYNKNLANKKKKLVGVKTSKLIKQITQNRNNYIDDYMHKASRYIVNHLIENNIECLVFGNNKQWKTGINIGKRNNQNFVQIPFYKFKMMLQYKCELVGIKFIEREESYTSKCSFIDLEDVKKHEEYKGSRVKRGLFKSSSGICVNADINGALNIIRKEFGNEYFGYNLTKLFANIKKVNLT